MLGQIANNYLTDKSTLAKVILSSINRIFCSVSLTLITAGMTLECVTGNSLCYRLVSWLFICRYLTGFCGLEVVSFEKAHDCGFVALLCRDKIVKQKGLDDMPVYSDSVNAQLWVRKKKCKTTLERNEKTEQLYQLIERAENWLKNNTYRNPIIKWPTEQWGEIPADFGRK